MDAAFYERNCSTDVRNQTFLRKERKTTLCPSIFKLKETFKKETTFSQEPDCTRGCTLLAFGSHQKQFPSSSLALLTYHSECLKMFHNQYELSQAVKNNRKKFIVLVGFGTGAVRNHTVKSVKYPDLYSNWIKITSTYRTQCTLQIHYSCQIHFVAIQSLDEAERYVGHWAKQMPVILVCFLIRLLYTVFQPESIQKQIIFFFLNSIPSLVLPKKKEIMKLDVLWRVIAEEVQ